MEKSEIENFWNHQDASIHSVFDNVVRQNPENIAIIDSDINLTYRELDDLSNQLAGALQNLEVGEGQAIAILLNKSYHYLVACFAILKLGSPYLNLEIGYTDEFLKETLKETSPAALITIEEFSNRVAFYSKPIIVLDADSSWKKHDLDKTKIYKVTSESPAFIGFTSGTTGKPKGMVVSHKAMLYSFFKFWEEIDSIPENDRFGYVTYMSWDALSPILFNKTGIILPDSLNHCYSELVDYLHRYSINHVFFTPSMLKGILEEMPLEIIKNKLSGLRVIWLGGEVVTQRLVNEIYGLFPECTLLNNYGPSECFVVSQGVLAKNYFNTNPICHAGKVLPEIDVLLLDENRKEVESGSIGFLYVSGPCLADGYLNQPELNKEKFINIQGKTFYDTGDLAELLPDNHIIIHGRDTFIRKNNDDYSALRKYEESIKDLPAVSDCILLDFKDDSNKFSTAAFIVLDQNKSIENDFDQIVKKIQSKFGDKMIPSKFVEIKSVPIKSTSQKADYSKLLHLIK